MRLSLEYFSHDDRFLPKLNPEFKSYRIYNGLVARKGPHFAILNNKKNPTEPVKVTVKGAHYITCFLLVFFYF